MKVTITNQSNSIHALDLSIPGGGHIGHVFRPREALDIGDRVSPEVLNQCQEFRRLLTRGLFTISFARDTGDSVPLPYDWQTLPGGGGSGGTGENARSVEFSPASPATQSLQALAVGQLLSDIRVIVETPFNDGAAFVKLGTSANSSAFMASSDSALATAGQFDNNRVYSIDTPDYLVMTVSHAAATSGSAYIFYRIQ